MAYIGNSPENIQRGRRAIYEFTSTAGQTVYTGLDDNNQTLDLLEANEQSVFLNGIRLVPTDDYTVSGDTLTLTSAASLNDHMIIETQTEVGNAVTYTRAESDARYINYDGDIVAGDLQISGEVDTGSLIVDTDVLVVDATNNRVGIKNSGTDISGTSLDDVVIGAGSTLAGIVLDGGASSDTAYGFASAGTKVGRISYINSSNNMIFQTDNADRMFIDGSGRVKIGTTSNTPASANEPGFVFGDNTAGTATAGVASFVANSAAPLLLTRRINDGNVLGIADDTTTRGLLRVDGGDLNVSSNANLRLSAGGSSAKMTILSGGNVGIGTDNPQQKLHVTSSVLIEGGSTDSRTLGFTNASGSTGWSIGNGIIDSTHNFRIYDNTAGAARLTVDGSGNVGIGTTSPSNKLEVLDNGGGQLKLLAWDQSTTAEADIDFWYLDAGGSPYQNAQISAVAAANAGNGNLVFSTRPTSGSLTEAMRIDSKGMIGVQSAMPSDVSGDCTSIRVGGLSVIGGVTGTNGKQNFHTGLYYNAYPTAAGSNKALVSKGSGNDYRPVKYVQKSGINTWYNAGSATAGSDITWTERMSLNQNGTLSLHNGTDSIYQYVRAPGGVMGTFFAGSVNNSSADYDITHLNPATNNNAGAFLMTSRETSSPSLGRVRTFILFLNDTGIATTQLSTNGSTAATLSFSRPNETTLRVTASNYNVHYINIIPIAGNQF